MSVAEYVAAFISIMIGLALADLATSLQRLLRAGARVRWDYLTPAAAILVTAFIINVWWAMFGALNAMRSLTVAGFIPDLISLLLLFCLASSALPDEIGERLDLADYYRSTRTWLWGLFALYTIWVTIVVGARTVAANASMGAFLGNVVPNAVLASLMLVLAVTDRRWVHAALISLLLLVTAAAWLPQELAGANPSGQPR
ncbi:MAG TPA: hypothetical protein VEZ70_06300 [Allosphingosinicella sp.]|nr:hypothetical protein [Allosphingosinicella sp.]